MPLISTTSDCIRCGLCVRACPYGVLGTDETGTPVSLTENCIRCGHCVAICPNGAFLHQILPTTSQYPIDEALQLDAAHVEQLLLSRRSIRQYRPEHVPEEILTRLLSVARYAPTAANMQGCSFQVINRLEVLRKLSIMTIEWAEEEVRRQTPFSRFLEPLVQSRYTTGRDVILRDAPCLVLSLLPQPMLPSMAENGRFPLVYAQLFAPALGLGSCWVGILEQCIHRGYPPVMEALALPEGMGFAGAIIVGFPSNSHVRIPDRNPLSITW